MTDSRLENKLGFDKIRRIISDRCMTEYAAGRVASEEFSTDAQEISRRLALTDEMRIIVMLSLPPRLFAISSRRTQAVSGCST